MIKDVRASRVIDAYTVSHTKIQTLTMHSRFAYGLSVAIDGEIIYTHNGVDYVSDPNHIILLPMGQGYTYRCTRTGTFTLVNFYPTADFSTDVFGRYRIEDNNEFLNLHRAMESASLSSDGARDARMLSMFYDMIARLSEDSSGRNHIVRAAQRYIEENISSPTLSNTDIARSCDISEVYLRKVFSSALDTSPKQYIQSARIRRAKALLCEGCESIGEISRMCGYSDVYTFSHAFKRATGYTPSKYREHSSVL